MRAVPLNAVAGKTRMMEPELLDPAVNQVSSAGMAYFQRLLPRPRDIVTPFV
jgi:hypothetical protein